MENDDDDSDDDQNNYDCLWRSVNQVHVAENSNPAEIVDTDVIHCKVHCSSSLAYFEPAVGSIWALRHYIARETAPAVYPPSQLPADCSQRYTCDGRKKRNLCVNCRDGFHQYYWGSTVTLAISAQASVVKISAWQQLENANIWKQQLLFVIIPSLLGKDKRHSEWLTRYLITAIFAVNYT
jgi:hypothetical protein